MCLNVLIRSSSATDGLTGSRHWFILPYAQSYFMGGYYKSPITYSVHENLGVFSWDFDDQFTKHFNLPLLINIRNSCLTRDVSPYL